jgi:hypothetical protein
MRLPLSSPADADADQEGEAEEGDIGTAMKPSGDDAPGGATPFRAASIAVK